jgi:ABC-type lipoprotein release transport system permease subunit
VSSLTRKARGDLKRHPARTVFTICTLGLAIGSLAIIAVPSLMDSTMQREVQQARLFDVAMTTHDLVLSPAQMGALRHLPNVAAFDAQIEFSTRAASGSNRQDAVIWGVDLASQSVDTVQLTTGHLPTTHEILGDGGNASAADFPDRIGEYVRLGNTGGTQTSLVVSGSAHSLATSPSASGSNSAVFYASESTVRALSGVRGVNYLAFRLNNNSSSAQSVTIAAVRGYLIKQTGTQPFVALPITRSQGDWPGRSNFNQIVALLYVISGLAVLCALFLIANTMNTLVVEQGTEIAILKTLGGRRRQIRGIILRTAAYLGGAGAFIGAIVGIAIAYLLTSFLATSLFDVHASFAISTPVVIVSLLLGPTLAALASIPGLRRALRRSVADTLADRGVSGYGNGRLDRLVARSHLLSGPARMGMRNVLRQKRRSAATIAQVAVAIALALALFAGGRSVTAAVDQEYASLHYQVEVDSNSGAPFLDGRARSIVAATPGISRVEPVVESGVQYQGQNIPAYGLGPDPLYHYRLRAGRWFTPADTGAAIPTVVLGPAFANSAHASVGQVLELDTAAGATRVKVIGIDAGQLNNGSLVYFPLAVLQRLTGMQGSSNALWITTISTNHQAITEAAASVQTRLGAAGFPVQSQLLYEEVSQNQAKNNEVLIVLEAVGLLVVAITLIGLVSALTMGVIERTREVGILRCLGAQSAQVRRVFSAEGVVLATIGWFFGTLFGWLLLLALLAFIRRDFGFGVAAVFPIVSVPVALVAIIGVTLVVIRAPLRRATRVQPGNALRYQ